MGQTGARWVWVGLGLSALCAALLVPGCTKSEARPALNVILITLDTTRADYLSAYGRGFAATPELDALAAEGALFERAHTTAAVTPVAHASILTGLNQYHHGLRVLSALSGYRLPREVPSLASILKQNGYSTAAIHSAFPVSAYFGLDQGFDVFLSFDAEVRVELAQDGSADATGGGQSSWEVKQYQRRSDETTDLALDYLKQSGEGFFLWIHYWDPHDPVLLPPRGHPSMPGDLSALDLGEQRRALYAAEVSYQDQQIGRLLSHLKTSGLMERTLVVVTADHGEGLSEHGWGSHRILYEEQIHVPLIIRAPSVTGGRRITELVGVVDIVPTVLDYAGRLEGYRGKFDGQSLRPLIEGSEAIEGRGGARRLLYADQINGYDFNAKMVLRRPKADFLYSLTRDPWKLIYRPSFFDQSELYQLQDDPDEAHNLWGQATDVRRELLQELARINSWRTTRFPEVEELGASDRQGAATALEELGYLGGESEDAPSDPTWAWTCIDHPELLLDRRGQCTMAGCKLLLLLRARPK